MTDQFINEDDSTDTQPTYRHGQVVPQCVLNALLYATGYQQWLTPNADSEYAKECRSICQGLYAAKLINLGQYDQSDPHRSEPDWESVREFREYIFQEDFYAPDLFEEHIEAETPDEMFDNVEAELVAHGLLPDIPPEREETYVSPTGTEQEAAE